MIHSIKPVAIAGLLSAAACFGYPVSMDIGLFAIDDYGSNGGGMANLNFMIASGQNFTWSSGVSVENYVNATASPGNGTKNPSMALDLRNSQVTWTAITDTNSTFGRREYCDFLYFGVHGYDGSPFLGYDNPPYGQVLPDQLKLGVGYSRWLLANSCALFNNGDPAAFWRPAFKGLKAMLGFKSYVFDNNLSWNLYYNFWTQWTFGEKSLMTAFFEAEANYGYEHLYPSKGLEPGCLSAQGSSDDSDYCLEMFKNVNHDYVAATANTGHFYSMVIGAPQY